ncbi:MAG: riboflavin biosynthesis protein RibF [Flavobacteriales bacterium]|nr:riboflavin biosynthesis protein RibF [Flavobacteriales bacterium]
MIVFHGWDALEPIPSVVTSGTFDGVHKGHQAICQRVTQKAKENGWRSLAITFHPHPRLVLKKNPENLALLNTLEERVERLGKTGLDALCVVEFTEALGRLDYAEYMALLLAKTGLRHLVVGYDHHFGRDRGGDPERIRALSAQLGIGFEEVPAVQTEGFQISSTKIRQALDRGDVRLARTMLGYAYPLSGQVVQGDGLGRALGFPTANLQPLDPLKLVPAAGIYAVFVQGRDFSGAGMAYIGNRPTLPESGRRIEVHIFDFERTLYGEIMTLHFHEFVRQDVRFDSLESLAQALQADARTVRALLAP